MSIEQNDGMWAGSWPPPRKRAAAAPIVDRARLTIYLPAPLARRLRIAAATEGEQISKLVEAAVFAHLEQIERA